MKRATRSSSLIFQNVLRQAEDVLTLAGEAAANYQHRGIRGDERAAALARFLVAHLPNVFAIGKGEAIDYRDNRTGQLDLCIYDAAGAAPILSSAENFLVPAESIYAVIEVKSVLTKAEMQKCVESAKRIRALKPFKSTFSASPVHGEASLDRHRCLYIVFAYTSDLSNDNWAQKEFERVKGAAEVEECSVDVIDRIVVLDRGLIRPQVGAARVRDEASGIFLDLYLHLVNFLARERKRRPDIDWTAYTSRNPWIKLT